MQEVPGARTFQAGGDAYDLFMGRYSKLLAVDFADFAGLAPGVRALDVGCGPGALTCELVGRLGAPNVAACDPSPPFLAVCSARNPGVDVRAGSAERVPYEDAAFDAALAQLVLHFVSDPPEAARQLRRVTRPGGVVAACVWDFDGMQMLRAFWDSALQVDPTAPDEARVLRFGRLGELAQWLDDGGFEAVTETTLTVASNYSGFEELWTGFLAGIGPAGHYLNGLSDDDRLRVRGALLERVGAGSFTMTAVARAARGTVPA